MKETKKKRKNYSSIYEEKGEVEQYLRNHHTSIQAKKKNPLRKYLKCKIQCGTLLGKIIMVHPLILILHKTPSKTIQLIILEAY